MVIQLRPSTKAKSKAVRRRQGQTKQRKIAPVLRRSQRTIELAKKRAEPRTAGSAPKSTNKPKQLPIKKPPVKKSPIKKTPIQNTPIKRQSNKKQPNRKRNGQLQLPQRPKGASRERGQVLPPSIQSSSSAVTQDQTLLPSVEVPTSSRASAVTSTEPDPAPLDEVEEFALLHTGTPYPLTDREASLVELVLRHPEMFVKAVKNRKGTDFVLGQYRNVNLRQSKLSDPLDINGFRPPSTDSIEGYHGYSEIENQIWDYDRAKCRTALEALFQRTLLLSMINRFKLYYGSKPDEESVFDFSVEAPWECPPMPTRGLDSENPEAIPLPKPDLCISFKSDSIITDDCRRGLSKALIRMINVEGTNLPHISRAFPLLVVEAKRGTKHASDPEILNQCLNSASIALHNMYEFFREAKLEDEFFETARFFTISAAATGCIFRIHRAVKAGPGFNARIVPSYPLKFEYNEIQTFKDEQFTRAAVVDLFDKIVWGYGTKLHEALKRAGENLEAQTNDPALGKKLVGRSEAHYRHGQSYIILPPKSREQSISLTSHLSSRPPDLAKRTPATTTSPSRDTPASNQFLALIEESDGSATPTQEQDTRENTQHSTSKPNKGKARAKPFARMHDDEEAELLSEEDELVRGQAHSFDARYLSRRAARRQSQSSNLGSQSSQQSPVQGPSSNQPNKRPRRARGDA